MTKAEFATQPAKCQRIAIARDLIERVKQKKLRVAQSFWVHFDGLQEVPEGDLCSLADKEPCQVCALGGLFMETLYKHGSLLNNILQPYNGGYGIDLKRIRSSLDDIFSDKQLKLIECAFEKGDGWYGYVTSEARDFGRRYKNDDERLIAIMENLVFNCGTYDPSNPVK